MAKYKDKIKGKLFPKVTLEDIYGQKHIFNPRASFSNSCWLPRDPARLDFSTAPPNIYAGNLPVITNCCVVSEKALGLLDLVGYDLAPNLLTYRTKADYTKLLATLKGQNSSIITNYQHPLEEVTAETCWISPKLLSFLNNKGSLVDLVPKEHLPWQRKVKPLDINSHVKKLPVVVKAATSKPSGGGHDVVICRRQEELEQASSYFKTCKEVLLEEYVEIAENYCIQFAKTYDDRIIYLGASQQITNSAGVYLGNWLLKDFRAPQALIELGLAIIKKASGLGYMGIAGFDIVITKDRRILALDLNFRTNGSTAPLFFEDSVYQACKSSVILFRSWKTSLGWEKFSSCCEEGIIQEKLIPFALYDNSLSPYPNSNILMAGLLTGNSKEEILNIERALFRKGIT